MPDQPAPHLEDIRRLPKAVLHDHLDGGLRVETILELAEVQGYTELPVSDAAGLRAYFHQEGSGSLERYLEAFAHTTAVMQTQEALERVAFEAIADLAFDGVVYAELRFAPNLHLRRGLRREDVIEAVLAGAARGGREHGVVWGVIVDALRQQPDSLEVARAAVRFAGEGVVGFDLAGPEAGFPADDHTAACRHAAEHGLALTIHAGEGDGAESIFRAVARCHAHRIGHGVRIVEDTRRVDGEIVELGSLARFVRDLRIPLEVAITSNLHTGCFADVMVHPFGALHDAGFVVTINTDNRLMSDVTVSSEYALAAGAYGLGLAELGAITETAILAGFGGWTERRRLLEEVVRPAYRERSAAS